MALTFAERMAARQKALEAGTLTTAPALTEAPDATRNAVPSDAGTTSPAGLPDSGNLDSSSLDNSTNRPGGFGFRNRAAHADTGSVSQGQGSGPNGGQDNSNDTGRLPLSAPAQAKPGFSRFGKTNPAGSTTQAPATEALAKAEEGPAKELVASPLPKVIQAFNVSGAAKPTMGEDLSGLPPQEAVKKIQQQIADLSKLENEIDLKYEMEKLSEMLVANPSACLYLLDEDLGLAVRALRKMTDNRVAIDMGRAKPKTGAKALGTAKAMSAADIAAALDEL